MKIEGLLKRKCPVCNYEDSIKEITLKTKVDPPNPKVDDAGMVYLKKKNI